MIIEIGSRISISNPNIIKSVGSSIGFTRLNSGVVVAANGGRNTVERKNGSVVISKPRCLNAKNGDLVMLWKPKFGFSKSVLFAMVNMVDLEHPEFTDTMLRIPITYASSFMNSHLDKISFSITSMNQIKDGKIRVMLTDAASSYPMSFGLYNGNGVIETHCMKSIVSKMGSLNKKLSSFKFKKQVKGELYFEQDL